MFVDIKTTNRQSRPEDYEVAKYLSGLDFETLCVSQSRKFLSHVTLGNGHRFYLLQNSFSTPRTAPHTIVCNALAKFGPFQVYGIMRDDTDPFYWGFYPDPIYPVDAASLGISVTTAQKPSKDSPTILYNNDSFSIMQNPSLSVLSINGLEFRDV